MKDCMISAFFILSVILIILCTSCITNFITFTTM
jgi:hypothetical protein